jgi:hypothetical protein
MNRLEFKLIKHFKPEEITKTGCTLESVSYELIMAYDAFRDKLGHPVCFVKNGFTTGDHKSKYHKSGEAGDSTIRCVSNFQKIFKCALDAGFKGIGFYYNHNTASFSFHFDIGKDYRFWKGIKNVGSQVWEYSDLILGPLG